MQYTEITWRDGQPYSEQFDDIYYSSEDERALADNDDAYTKISGEDEFKHVFFTANNLPDRWLKNKDFVIAELGLGSTLNCFLTIREWLKHIHYNFDSCASHFNNKQRLHYIAIEKYPLAPETINAVISRYPELDIYRNELLDNYPPAVKGSHTRFLFNNTVCIHYKFMDVYEALKDEKYHVDAWYLDGFSPAKNPEMWSSHVFDKIAQNSNKEATCSTYTAAGFVKRNFQVAGFTVKKNSGYGKKRDMLVAMIDAQSHLPNQTNYQSLKFIDKPWFVAPRKPKCKKRQATIIGAGVAGLSVAYSLIKRGWYVTIIDKQGKPASATSSNPAAIVYPKFSVDNPVDMQFYVNAYCYTLYILTLLQKKNKQKFWFKTGLLQLNDKDKFNEIQNKFNFNSSFVDSVDALTSIKNEHEICLNFKDAGVVLPKVLCDVLVKECGDNLTIIEGTVSTITRDNNVWQCNSKAHSENCSGININIDKRYESEIVVIASGVNVNELLSGFSLPVETVRGQSLVLNNGLNSDLVKTANANCYFTSLINGKHFLGATYSRNNKNTEVDEKDNINLLEELEKVYPGIFTRENISTSWVGFRSTARDRVPIIGAIPDQDFFKAEYDDIHHGKQNKIYRSAKYLNGLYVSVAHGSRGFTTSFLCAELIASQIEGSVSPVSKVIVDYLSPSRFIVNDLKRRR